MVNISDSAETEAFREDVYLPFIKGAGKMYDTVMKSDEPSLCEKPEAGATLGNKHDSLKCKAAGSSS